MRLEKSCADRGAQSGSDRSEPTLALALIVGGTVGFIYLTVAWRSWGRTWGDQLLGLRVVDFQRPATP